MSDIEQTPEPDKEPDKEPDQEQQSKSRLIIFFLPLLIFFALCAIFYGLLNKEGRNVAAVPSPLLDKPAPQTPLPALEVKNDKGEMVAGLEMAMLKDKISVVNIFASWCAPCRSEHPQIVDLAKDGRFQVIGINYKDNDEDAIKFLNELGNPYDIIGADNSGRAGIEWGVYGIPETFLINREGRIFYKHVGPINRGMLQKTILPLLEGQL